jgi:hypothetical protein
MIVINFSHPLTEPQIARIEKLCGRVDQVVEVACQMDVNRPFDTQIVQLVDQVGLDSAQWRACQIAVGYPALAAAALGVMATLLGRCGYIPPAIRLRQQPGVVPPRYEVAELIDLNVMRAEARKQR